MAFYVSSDGEVCSAWVPPGKNWARLPETGDVPVEGGQMCHQVVLDRVGLPVFVPVRMTEDGLGWTASPGEVLTVPKASALVKESMDEEGVLIIEGTDGGLMKCEAWEGGG